MHWKNSRPRLKQILRELRGWGPHMTNWIEIIVQIDCFIRRRTFIVPVSIFNARFAVKSSFHLHHSSLSFSLSAL